MTQQLQRNVRKNYKQNKTKQSIKHGQKQILQQMTSIIVGTCIAQASNAQIEKINQTNQQNQTDQNKTTE